MPIAQDYGEEAYATEPHENLLAFFDGLPAGAIDNHNDLIQQSIAAAKEALVAFHPDTIEKLAENRRVLGEALRLAVGYDESSATLQGATKGACADLPYVDSVLVGDIRGVKIPLRTFMPATSCGVSTVLIDPLGKQRLDMGLVRELLARGHAVYAIDPFATGENVGEQEAATPRGSTNFFTTFNRTAGSVDALCYRRQRFFYGERPRLSQLLADSRYAQSRRLAQRRCAYRAARPVAAQYERCI